jgi:valine dehydrogenase (NAD+)
MGVFSGHSGSEDTSHEQVVFCQDKPTGLRAIIGIYSTALGPALGGTRYYPYQSEDEAVHDVLELSRGMAYKNSLAGLDLGGGKAVIWGDPERVRPVRGLARRALHHRLRRRHLRGGHGHGRPGEPVGDRSQ